MQFPPAAFMAMGLEKLGSRDWEEHTFSLWAVRPSTVLPPMPQDSLAFPLVEAEQGCFCAPLFQPAQALGAFLPDSAGQTLQVWA
jgi:hypothetical protein